MNATQLNDAFLAYENELLLQAQLRAEYTDVAEQARMKPRLDQARSALVQLLGNHTHKLPPVLTPDHATQSMVMIAPVTTPMVEDP